MRLACLLVPAVLMSFPVADGWRQEVPGERVVIRQSAKVVGDGLMAAAMAAQAGDWTTVSITARGRTRTDVTEGVQPGSKPGDYILFDQAEMIVVTPASKSFVRFRMTEPEPNRLADSLGIRTVTDSVRAAADPVVVRDTVDGEPVDRYTVRMGYRSTTTFDTMRVSFRMPATSVSTSTVTDYWFALSGTTSPGSPPAWITSLALLGDLAAKMREAMAGFPRRPVLKTRSVITVTGSAGPGGMERTTRFGKRESVAVDLERLVLPPDYVEAGNYIARGDTLWIPKWRSKP